MVGGNLYCTISIWDDDKKQWVSKMDVGTESYTEKEKGQASDSFKRACVSLGIGRELYTAPFIWVGASKVRIDKKPDNSDRGKEKLFTYDKFKVVDISYNDSREITGLSIVNQDGKTVYCLGGKGAVQKSGRNMPSAEAGQKAAVNGAMPNAGQKQTPDRAREMDRELGKNRRCAECRARALWGFKHPGDGWRHL